MNFRIKKQYLTFTVIGGGPTSVEFAAELHDFIKSDVKKLYPNIHTDEIKIKRTTDSCSTPSVYPTPGSNKYFKKFDENWFFIFDF